MITTEGQAMRPRAWALWLRAAIGLFLFAALAVCLFLARGQMKNKSGLHNIIRSHGSPVFVADEALIEQGRLRLVNALQLDDASLRALDTSVPPRFFGKWLLLCADRVQAESLKVLHAGSITVGSGALYTDPVARAIADIPHPVNADRGELSLVRFDAHGTISTVRAERVSEILFRFQ